MNRDSAERLLPLVGQGRDVAWWIVGIVFRHVPDMAAITAAVVVHLCVLARSRKPLNASRDRPFIRTTSLRVFVFAGVLIEAGAAYEWACRALPRMRTRASEKLAYVNR
jgi:hypothetical protein